MSYGRFKFVVLVVKATRSSKVPFLKDLVIPDELNCLADGPQKQILKKHSAGCVVTSLHFMHIGFFGPLCFFV